MRRPSQDTGLQAAALAGSGGADGKSGLDAGRHFIPLAMHRLLAAVSALAALSAAQPLAEGSSGIEAQAEEAARLGAEAGRVTIVRDDWGIAHVRGKTDADAVFGMIYAQAEDDFNRVETNYINAMGRLAEAEGESCIYKDLRMKLFIDPVALRAQYAASPDWLKRLMDAFADGLNLYLSEHPGARPRVIRRFEPWMALSFTEGSIGGDIESIDVKGLEAFYGHPRTAGPGPRPATEARAEPAGRDEEGEPGGSNGFAVAPSNSAAHHALLLINPHTSFFFRSELQMSSDEGLGAYGAVTWGQFFVYQGFNDRAGWMHTSSGVDAVDEYLETVQARAGRLYYRYGDGEREMAEKRIVVPYRTAEGMKEKSFTAYFTHHGPVIREENGKWVSDPPDAGAG
jgi:acyl-homoserine-lactone acylase